MKNFSNGNGERRIELDGKAWLQNSISIWSELRKTSDENGLNHPASFPILLVGRLLSCFSFEDDKILDPFAGTGSTLIAAKRMNRYSFGIELSQEFIKIYNSRSDLKSLFEDKKYTPEMIHDDANNLLNYVEESSIQLTVTSPPYWDILNQKRTAYNKEANNYSDSKKDLGNIKTYKEFLKALETIFTLVFKVTKKCGFCCIILMDLRKKDKFYPFHIDAVQFMEEIGFKLDDIIIWDRRHEYNNLKPLGYPYVFRINKVHEFILVFIKR